MYGSRLLGRRLHIRRHKTPNANNHSPTASLTKDRILPASSAENTTRHEAQGPQKICCLHRRDLPTPRCRFSNRTMHKKRINPEPSISFILPTSNSSSLQPAQQGRTKQTRTQEAIARNPKTAPSQPLGQPLRISRGTQTNLRRGSTVGRLEPHTNTCTLPHITAPIITRIKRNGISSSGRSGTAGVRGTHSRQGICSKSMHLDRTGGGFHIRSI